MTGDELRQLFRLCSCGRLADAVVLLTGIGQPLAALRVYSVTECHKIFEALDVKISAGELDPMLVGVVARTSTSTAPLQYLTASRDHLKLNTVFNFL